MCSHSGSLDSVECHMDDLVCSFEDFVKKFLIIVSLALGAVVLMLVYVLKIVTDRTVRSIPVIPNPPETTEVDNIDIGLQYQNIDVKSEDKRCLVTEKYEEVPVSTHAVNTSPIASYCDENRVDNIACSASSQSCSINKTTLPQSISATRTEGSSTNCLAKDNAKTSRPCIKLITQKKSCCSMCCEDDEVKHS